MGNQEHVHKLGYRTNQDIQKSHLNLERLTGHPNKQWSYDGILGGGSGNLYDENINAARATSVLYSGTFNGEKQYNVAVSTDNTALVTMTWKWWGLFDFHMEEVNIEGAIMNRGPGYHSRNEENRIRAVYKPKP